MTLFGCSSLSIKRDGYDVPKLALPAKYKNSNSTDKPEAADVSADANEIPPKLKVPHDPGLTEWWRAFGNRELEGLIDRGLANNPDLRMAVLRVAQAKERLDQAKAGKLPTVTAPLATGLDAPGPIVGNTAGTGSLSKPQRSYRGSLQANWHTDVWGEVSSLVESSRFQLWRAVFERDDAQRTMVANLTSAYLDYVALNDRLREARENEKVLNEIQTTLERRVEVGDATLSDAAQQRAGIFALRAAIPSMEQQREDLLNTIAFLAGAVPGTLTLSDSGFDSISQPPVMSGLPSALLLRRPDVRMAEARLLSADADIDVARAKLLPPIDLSAGGGVSTIFFSQIFMVKSLFWNVLANATLSIFDGGKKESDKKISQEVHEEMVEAYVKVIYQAMREVEGALSTVRLTERRMDSARQATAAAREAWEINTRVFALGAVEYQTFLDTERAYHRYLDDYQQIRMENRRAYISLFSALGGGVAPAETLPGKGARPALAQGGSAELRPGADATTSSAAALVKPYSIEGVDRTLGSSGDMKVENFWQVELPGLYHRTTIGAVWRDLRTRYPGYTKNLFLRPRLNGKVDDSEDGQESWYRLYVAKFSSLAMADEFCTALKESFQRCRIVSSRSDDTVIYEGADQKTKAAGAELGVATVKLAVPSLVDQPAKEAAAPAAVVPVAVPFVLKLDPILAATALPVDARNDSGAGRGPIAPKEVAGAKKARLTYAMQFGIFSSQENAGSLQSTLKSRGIDAYLADSPDSTGRALYAVRAGAYGLRSEANAAALSVRRKESMPVLVVSQTTDAQGGMDVGEQPLASPKLEPPSPPEPVAAVKPAEASPGAKPDAKNAGQLAYAVQMGAFPSMKNASDLLPFWDSRGYKPYINETTDAEGRTLYAVRTGSFPERRKASVLAKAITRKMGVPAIVVQLNEPQIPPLATESKPEASAPEPEQKPYYAIQLGAFSSLQAAARAYAVWREKGNEVYVCELRAPQGEARFAVRQGEFAKRSEADSLAKAVGRKSKSRPILVMAQRDSAGKLEKVDVAALMQN